MEHKWPLSEDELLESLLADHEIHQRAADQLLNLSHPKIDLASRDDNVVEVFDETGRLVGRIRLP